MSPASATLPHSTGQSFSEILKQHLSPKTKGLLTSLLPELNYQEEVQAKTMALQQFWNGHKLPLQPQAIVPSPRARHYRTTSKRRIHWKNNCYRLFRMEDDQETLESLEAESHAVLYQFFQKELNRPVNSELSRRTHYVIIRGALEQPSIILNIDEFNALVIRRAKALAEKLQHLSVHVFSAFLFLDPTRSQYYLEGKRPAASINFKKLFGPDMLYLKVFDKLYSYSPLGFSQVNESMIPQLLMKAGELLSPQITHRLIDLYCGYGLFSHYLAALCAEVIGVEISPMAIRSAVNNKRYLNPKIPMRFNTGSISRTSLNKMLPHPDHVAEMILLDPPYQGTNPGVIETITQRNAERILHIFCSMDALSREFGSYVKNGYRLQQAVPMDLFPGTPNLEMLLLFTRS